MKRHAMICGFAVLLCSMIVLGACSKSNPPQEQKPAMEQQQPQAEMQAPPASATAAATYSCPMHPEVTATEPSKCSKCGMDLVQAEPAPAAPESSAAHTEGH